MSYRKQISYLELRENEQRVKNVGYAKLESLDKKYILTIQINGLQDWEDRKLPLYLRKEAGEDLLCELVVNNGKIVCEREIDKTRNEGQLQEIRILIDGNVEIIGRFAKQNAKSMSLKPVAERPEEMQEKTSEKEVIAEDKVKIQEQIVSESTIAEEGTIKKEKKISAERKKENVLQMKDTKWEQLNSLYPHIHPFRDTREFLSVGPEDFVILRERCYQMTHNSFLLHGYYNYRHLLLMRQEKKDQIRYYIGVPGNFYEREKQVARMFGFESFEGMREPAWEGDFGYYMISVEL